MIGQLAAYLRVQMLVFVRTAGPGKLIGLLLVLFFSALGVAGGIAAGIGAYWLAGVITSTEVPTAPAVSLVVNAAVVGYCFLALFGIMTDMQRHDPFDIGKLLYLPMPLFLVFFFNLLASMFTMGNIVFLPALVGFTAGLSRHLGSHMALGLLHGLLFIVALSGLLYLCRGVLAGILRNRRRRNLFLTLATFGFVLLFQLPSLAYIFFGDALEAAFPDTGDSLWDVYAVAAPFVELANQWIPPLWMAYGFRALAENDLLGAWISLAGLAAFAAIILHAAHRQTVRSLRAGGERGIDATGREFNRSPFTGRGLPILGNDTAALALATALGLSRTQLGQLMLVSPFFVVLIFWLMSNMSPEGVRGGSFIFFAIAIPYFSALSFLLNQFGLDREAFRTLLLLPTARSRVLLAKNAGFAPFVVLPSLLLLALYCWWLDEGVLEWLRYAFVSLTVYFAIATVGNFMSSAVPTRMNADRMGRSGGNQLVMMFSNFIGMVILMATVAFALLTASLAARFLAEPLGSPERAALLFNAGLCLVAAVIWRIALVWAGDVLQEKEQEVLATLERGKD